MASEGGIRALCLTGHAVSLPIMCFACLHQSHHNERHVACPCCSWRTERHAACLLFVRDCAPPRCSHRVAPTILLPLLLSEEMKPSLCRATANSDHRAHCLAGIRDGLSSRQVFNTLDVSVCESRVFCALSGVQVRYAMGASQARRSVCTSRHAVLTCQDVTIPWHNW